MDMNKVIFGQHVVEAQNIRRDAQVKKSAKVLGCYDSASICNFLSSEASRGILGAELVESIYGWTLRYDSGLQNFGIIAGKRMGNTDGSLDSIMEIAKNWQAADADRRYVWCREMVAV